MAGRPQRPALDICENGVKHVTWELSPPKADPTFFAAPHWDQVSEVGALAGRTVSASDALPTATEMLLRDGRRRLAVVDDCGRLLGLLCLKRDRTGFCSDEGIRRRAAA